MVFTSGMILVHVKDGFYIRKNNFDEFSTVV